MQVDEEMHTVHEGAGDKQKPNNKRIQSEIDADTTL